MEAPKFQLYDETLLKLRFHSKCIFLFFNLWSSQSLQLIISCNNSLFGKCLSKPTLFYEFMNYEFSGDIEDILKNWKGSTKELDLKLISVSFGPT